MVANDYFFDEGNLTAGFTQGNWTISLEVDGSCQTDVDGVFNLTVNPPMQETITVTDGSVLPSVDGSTLAPAVIFIDKERIEYFTVTGNTLGQIRRGTLGTGIKEHRSGAEVVDASGTQTIPYADTVYTDTFTGDGSTTAFALSQAPTDASQLDIFIGGQRLLLTSEDGSTINYSVGGGNDTDITTATFVKASPSVSSQDGDVRDVKFNNDGTKMFMLG